MKTTTNQQQALKSIKQDKDFNLKTQEGFIYYVGDILSKLVGTDHYICHKGRWVRT